MLTVNESNLESARIDHLNSYADDRGEEILSAHDTSCSDPVMAQAIYDYVTSKPHKYLGEKDRAYFLCDRIGCADDVYPTIEYMLDLL